METRYQVFVSSTFKDLQEERQAVMQALLELDCIPSGMELFPASDETAWELIKRVIDGCDYYIIIVGGRYGSQDAEGVSYTEREFDHAVKQGIPVLGFVHADPMQIVAGKTELDAEGQAKLAAFRDKVLHGCPVSEKVKQFRSDRDPCLRRGAPHDLFRLTTGGRNARC